MRVRVLWQYRRRRTIGYVYANQDEQGIRGAKNGKNIFPSHVQSCAVTVIRIVAAAVGVSRTAGQAAGNDESGCDKSMESHSGGGRLELALVARLLSMLSKKNSSSSSLLSSSWRCGSSSTSFWSRSRAAAVAKESGGSWTSSTAGRTVFLLSIRQRLCRTRFRRRNSFLVVVDCTLRGSREKNKNKNKIRQ